MAAAYVTAHGTAVECARLTYLIDRRPAPAEIIGELLKGQREDGGWAPPWAADYSSVDATCYRLAQAEQLGLGFSDPFVAQAVQFLISRQQADGSWEEDGSVASFAPPWAQQGSEPARLYLTANCGFWVEFYRRNQGPSLRAADYLLKFQSEDGSLPSFLHASWLAAGLWQLLGDSKAVQKALDYLNSRLPEMEGSSLAWMAITLLVAGLNPSNAVLNSAADRLERLQQADGHWDSEDGPQADVHTTLEALRLLRLLGHW